MFDGIALMLLNIKSQEVIIVHKNAFLSWEPMAVFTNRLLFDIHECTRKSKSKYWVTELGRAMRQQFCICYNV